MKKVTDQTKMWFGKHRGSKMEDIPADYFINYLDGRCEKRIQDYIDENRDVLEKEMLSFRNH